MSNVIEARLLALLREVLGLPASFPLARPTLLLGAISALDSVAVVTLLEECETTFGFIVADDEVSAEIFTSVGTLVDWVAARATLAPRP
jgi:acyl carrier protein